MDILKMKTKLTILIFLLIAISVTFLVQRDKPAPAAAASNAVTKTAAKPKVAAAKPNACGSTTAIQTIIVSLNQQHLWACDNNLQVYDTPVTTGATAYGDATPTGTWAIYSKQTDTHLTGSDSRGSWDDFVNYWMPFYGAYGFHDATWQTFAFGSLTQYQTGGSHGCVHLPLAAMKWLFNWAPVGTVVTVAA